MSVLPPCLSSIDGIICGPLAPVGPGAARAHIGMGEIVMKLTWMLPAAVAVLLLQLSSTAQAFECPKYFATAQATIDKATLSMMGMEDRMSKEDVARIQAHIGNAKMTLAEAIFHHENPEGLHHHARAIMRASAAAGHALAAVSLHDALMKQ